MLIKILKTSLIFIIMMSWFLSDLSFKWRGSKLSFETNKAEALTGIIRPDGDGTPLQWISTGASHYTEINETVTAPNAGSTAQNVNNGSSASNVDTYNMGTLSGVGSVSQVQVYVYFTCTNKNSVMSVDMIAGGITYNGTITSSSTANEYLWGSYTFSGLNLSQSDLDGLQIQVSGDSGGRTYTIATLYANITYSTGVSISISTDGSVGFGVIALNTTKDTTSSGINDPETISIDTGPANLNIKTTLFSEGGNNWTLGASSNGQTQVLWEFSKDSTNWTVFASSDPTTYTFDTNVAQGATRNLYLRLTMPTTTNSYNQYSSTVTIVASAP